MQGVSGLSVPMSWYGSPLCLDYGSYIRLVTDGESSFREYLETEVVSSEVFPSRSNLTTYGNPTVRRHIIYAAEKASSQEKDGGSCLHTSCNFQFDRREVAILRPTEITSPEWLPIRNKQFWCHHSIGLSATVAAHCKTWTVFAHSDTGIVGSNPTRGIDICMRLFYVCVILYVGSGLATGWSPVQGVLPNLYRMKKLNSGQGPTKGSRAMDR
jgi:hypothetical protein